VSASFQKNLRRTCLEQIACTADGLQVQGIFRVGFNFFAEAADVDVHASGCDEAVGAPNGVKQLVAGEDAIGTRGQVVEQAKFERAERDGLAGMADAIGSRVDGQASDFDDARRVDGRLGATQQGFDAGDELAGAEGLGDVIVGAHFEADNAVGFIAARGQHENGKPVEGFVLADFTANVQAGHFREHQIEQEKIGRRLLERGEAAGAVEGGVDLKAFVGKVIADQFNDIAIVFNDQYAFHEGISRSGSHW
jgi:hypothetical protein